MCDLFRIRGDRRPLAVDKADHADAFSRFPLKEEAELAVVVTPLNPIDGRQFGFILRRQLFGSAATGLHYNCVSRAIASLAFRYLKIPRIGYYRYYWIVAPRPLIKLALKSCARFSGVLVIVHEKLKSAAGPMLEFSPLTQSFRFSGLVDIQGPGTITRVRGGGERTIRGFSSFPTETRRETVFCPGSCPGQVWPRSPDSRIRAHCQGGGSFF